MIIELYRHAGNRRPCCISGGKFHQYCHCSRGPVSYCKSECDKDDYCKGYVAYRFGNPEGKCQIATASDGCPYGCIEYNRGNVGPLIANESCGDVEIFGGCHIKVLEGV